MSKNLVLVLDTETIGVCDPTVYDLGYVIYDLADGKVLVARDYLTKEVYGQTERMKTAYYANKLPLYEERLADGYCKKVKWSYILRQLKRDINKYKVDGLWAYNSGFDKRAIAETCKELKVNHNPTADGINDIWKGLTDPHITESAAYQEFCRRNGYFTKHKKPRVRATAEIVFRFLTQDEDYQEQHTALEDSKIEAVILRKARALAMANAQTERNTMDKKTERQLKLFRKIKEEQNRRKYGIFQTYTITQTERKELVMNEKVANYLFEQLTKYARQHYVWRQGYDKWVEFTPQLIQQIISTPDGMRKQDIVVLCESPEYEDCPFEIEHDSPWDHRWPGDYDENAYNCWKVIAYSLEDVLLRREEWDNGEKPYFAAHPTLFDFTANSAHHGVPQLSEEEYTSLN